MENKEAVVVSESDAVEVSVLGCEVRRVKVAVFPDGRVDRKNAAAFLGREPKTLAEWHSKGIGPRGFLVGGRVFYWWGDLQSFARGERVAA